MITDKEIEELRQERKEKEAELCQCKFCTSCGRVLEDKDFYTFKDYTLDNVCKECRLKGKSDRFPEDYFPLFELYDIPYFFKEWDALVNYHVRCCVIENKPYTSIFGKYLSKMKLKGFKDYSYKDSDYLMYQGK